MTAHPSPKRRWGFLSRATALWGATLTLYSLAMGTALAQHHVRPDGTPDVLIMVFDGQNCTWGTNPGHWNLLCDAKDNFDDLSNRPGFRSLAELLQQRGYSVEIRGYAGKFQGSVSSVTRRYERGLEDALHDLDTARSQWIEGYLNPTRLIVTGASAGGIWAHLAILANPDLTFDYLIDSDSVCLYWARNYRSFQRVVGIGTPSGTYIRTKLSRIDLERLCMPGTRPSLDGSWLRLTNLVPSNVLINLEAQTRPWGGQNPGTKGYDINLPNDYVLNRRISGSRQSIYTVLDLVDMHGAVFMPGHAATQWMLDMIAALGMPPSPLIAGSQEVVRRGRLSLPGQGLFGNLNARLVPAGKVEPDSAIWTLEP